MGEFYGNQHTGSTYENYDYEDLLEDVATLAAERGEAPTTRDAEADDRLPCLSRMYDVIEEDWSTVLADAGVAPDNRQVGSYDAEDHEDMVTDLRRVNRVTTGETLTTREYDDHGEFATSTVKKHFGSWSEACEVAGIDSGQRHGEQCLGPNGNRLDSRHELAVARYLDELGVDYQTHVRLGETLWTCDFHLLELDLWVEVDGYVADARPNERSFTQKLGYYAFRGMDFAVVTTVAELERELQKRGAL